MRVLFVAGPTVSTALPMVPLAQAARRVGHEVFTAASEPVLPAFVSAGLAAVPVSSKTLEECRRDRRGESPPLPAEGNERDLAVGRMLGRFAADCLTGLLRFVADWRPGIVVGAAQATSAPLVAHHVGVPYVRFATDLAEPLAHHLGSVAELGPELEQAGLYDVPRPLFSVSVAPAGVRADDSPPALAMRHVPYDTQCPAEPWMYTRKGPPRILVYARSDDGGGGGLGAELSTGYLRTLLPRLSALDAELLLAVSDSAAVSFPEPPGGRVHIGRMPLDVVAVSCDLIVHAGDVLPTLAGLAHGVPQLALPHEKWRAEHSARVARLGAARLLRTTEATPDAVVQACSDLLADPSYRDAAARLQTEVLGMPVPAAVVRELEKASRSRPAAKEERG